MVSKTRSKKTASRKYSVRAKAAKPTHKQRESTMQYFGFSDPLVGILAVILSLAIIATLFLPPLI